MHVDVVDALATRRLVDATDITFEYLAVTQGEAGRLVPQDIQELPPALREVLDTLAQAHRPPGVLLLALLDEQVVGTIAMRPTAIGGTEALVQRLYVRPPHRRRGVARLLLARLHTMAAQAGLHRLILNVMADRGAAVALYLSADYAPMPEPEGWAWGGLWLCRESH